MLMSLPVPPVNLAKTTANPTHSRDGLAFSLVIFFFFEFLKLRDFVGSGIGYEWEKPV